MSYFVILLTFFINFSTAGIVIITAEVTNSIIAKGWRTKKGCTIL